MTNNGFYAYTIYRYPTKDVSKRIGVAKNITFPSNFDDIDYGNYSVILALRGIGMQRAIDVKPMKNYLLLIRFDNGEDRICDNFPLLNDRLFSRLEDENYFNTVHVDNMGLVCWDDSTDVNPYELYENSEITSKTEGA